MPQVNNGTRCAPPLPLGRLYAQFEEIVPTGEADFGRFITLLARVAQLWKPLACKENILSLLLHQIACSGSQQLAETLCQRQQAQARSATVLHPVYLWDLLSPKEGESLARHTMQFPKQSREPSAEPGPLRERALQPRIGITKTPNGIFFDRTMIRDQKPTKSRERSLDATGQADEIDEPDIIRARALPLCARRSPGGRPSRLAAREWSSEVTLPRAEVERAATSSALRCDSKMLPLQKEPRPCAEESMSTASQVATATDAAAARSPAQRCRGSAAEIEPQARVRARALLKATPQRESGALEGAAESVAAHGAAGCQEVRSLPGSLPGSRSVASSSTATSRSSVERQRRSISFNTRRVRHNYVFLEAREKANMEAQGDAVTIKVEPEGTYAGSPGSPLAPSPPKPAPMEPAPLQAPRHLQTATPEPDKGGRAQAATLCAPTEHVSPLSPPVGSRLPVLKPSRRSRGKEGQVAAPPLSELLSQPRAAAEATYAALCTELGSLRSEVTVAEHGEMQLRAQLAEAVSREELATHTAREQLAEAKASADAALAAGLAEAAQQVEKKVREATAAFSASTLATFSAATVSSSS